MRTAAQSTRSESGFTVVELTITMAISMLVMASILGVLDSQSRAERRVHAFANNQETLRRTIVAMQRDIRSSEPLSPLRSSEDYALRIDLKVYEDVMSPTPVPIRWLVDTATKELRRETLDANGNVIGISDRVQGVTNNFGSPLFTFYKATGSAYQLGADPAVRDTPGDIAQCTVRIQIRLVAAPEAGPDPAILISDAQLRNRLPGAPGCPQVGVTGSTTTTVP